MSAADIVIEQPGAYGNGTKAMRYHGGSERSKDRLRVLNYDPIGELVKTYREIEQLIQREYDIRDGKIVVYSASTQKPLTWRSDLLNNLLDKKERIANNLLRYGYGRVPEHNVVEEKVLPAFVVHTTQKGVVYHTGDKEDDDG